MSFVISKNHFHTLDRKDGRLKLLAIFFFLMGIVLVARLFTIQVVQHNFYESMAEKRNDVQTELIPTRGSVYVKEKDELYPLVTNKDYYLIYADPRKIADKAAVVDALTPILELEQEEWKGILQKLGKADDPYEPIKRKVPKEKVDQIEALAFDGIYFSPETYRYYPEENVGGHILGFVGFNENERVGRYGIEGYFNDILRGEYGYLESVKDARGLPVTVGKRNMKKAIDGSDVVLTIDRAIQTKACELIQKAVSDFDAKVGSIIVMNPKTGSVIAMCSMPDFVPEKYNEVDDINSFNNPAIFHAYEPGSVFKAITMAAALDLGIVQPETTYEDTGEVKLIGHKPIKNSDLKAHGTQTMIQVLEKSLNTGAVFVVNKLGKESFRKYVQDFGFGQRSGIQLDYEAEGNISSLDKRGEIYVMTASFGQGITVTSLQLLNAFAAIANGGKLVQPSIVDEIRFKDTIVEKTQPQVVRQVLHSRSATLLHGMLVSAVENGWGKKASVRGYYIAGKTGTAQVAEETGQYGTKTIHTFIGYGPATDPRFVMLVKLDYPTAVNFSSDSTTLVFGQMAAFLLQYWQVPPER